MPDYANSMASRPAAIIKIFVSMRFVCVECGGGLCVVRRRSVASRAKQSAARILLQPGIDKYVNQYTLDGKPLSSDRSTGLIAMNAVAALAATTDKSRSSWKHFGMREFHRQVALL